MSKGGALSLHHHHTVTLLPPNLQDRGAVACANAH
jgi:hypothetical protein